MILEIVKYGHPALRTKGARITKADAKIHKLAEDMLDTMEAANGVGLAAQQVGVPIQLTVAVDVPPSQASTRSGLSETSCSELTAKASPTCGSSRTRAG